MERFEQDFNKHIAIPVMSSKQKAVEHYTGLVDQLHKQQYDALMSYWEKHKRLPLSTIVDQISRDLNQVIAEKVKEQFKDVVEAFRKAESCSDVGA